MGRSDSVIYAQIDIGRELTLQLPRCFTGTRRSKRGASSGKLALPRGQPRTRRSSQFDTWTYPDGKIDAVVGKGNQSHNSAAIKEKARR